MKNVKLTVLLFLFLGYLAACSADSPKDDPQKPDGPEAPPMVESGLKGSFESKFVRYSKGQQFAGQKDDSKVITIWKDTVWQNDRVHRQLVLWTNKRCDGLTYEVSDLVNGEKDIPSSSIRLRFPSYVMGDANSGTCGDYEAHSTVLIADALPETPVTTVTTTEPLKIWLTADIPADAAPGTYSGNLVVKSGGEVQQTFKLQFLVTSHRLPPASEWGFHLDLWQFPFQLSNLCTDNGEKITPFSDTYFSLIKPFYRLLADAGQKAITVYIKDGAFNPGQTMVKWMKEADGTWSFDYSDFDRYVSTLMSWGINKQIDCFSLVGWNTSIGYTDSAGKPQTLKLSIGSDTYNAVWSDFLTSFRDHLKEKGWFEKTVLYMDEVKENEMHDVVSLIHGHDASWKIGLSGSYIPSEIEGALYDYSTILGYDRSSSNTISTFYTSCSQSYPNNFVTSRNNPAEMCWMAWYAKAKGFNGYLRWAYDYWTKIDPVNIQDGSNAAGDFSMIYRDGNTQSAKPVSSIRFELLREGIQDYEKVGILSDSKLNSVIQKFTTTSGGDAEKLVEAAEKLLKEISINK